MRLSSTVVVTLALALVLDTYAMGAFTFTKIVGLGDRTSEGALLSSFDLPYFDGTVAAFTSGRALYGWFGSEQLRRIADESMPAPGGGTFTKTGSPSVNGGRVAFTAHRRMPDGTDRVTIYLYDNGKIVPVVEEKAPLSKGGGRGAGASGGAGAGAGGTLGSLADFSLNGDRVAFASSSYDKVTGKDDGGIFTASLDGKINRIVDYRTAVPGYAGLKFGTFDDVRMDGDAVTFYSQSRPPNKPVVVKGIYQAGPKGCVRVVDTQMPVPGRSDVRFREVRLEDTDGSDAIFRALFMPPQAKLLDPRKARSVDDWAGLYAWRGGRLQRIADDSMPIPGGTGTFRGFASATTDGGRVAFAASDATDLAGPLEKLVGAGDTLDGKTVQHTNLINASMGGGRIALTVRFTDGSEGLYLAAAAGGATTRP